MSGGAPPKWQAPAYTPELFTRLSTSYALGLRSLARKNGIAQAQGFHPTLPPFMHSSPFQAWAQHVSPAPGVSSTPFQNGFQQTPLGNRIVVNASMVPRPLLSGPSYSMSTRLLGAKIGPSALDSGTKRMQTVEPEAARPIKKVKNNELAPTRLRVGNLRYRVTKDDIEHLFRHYPTGKIDLIHTKEGLSALVTLIHPVMVREAIYRLWDEKVHGQKITIEMYSGTPFDYHSAESTHTTTKPTTSSNTKQLDTGNPVASAIATASELPAHLYHHTPSHANASSLREDTDYLDRKAIGEKRRVYIYNLAFKTDEQMMRNFLGDLSVESLTIPYNWNIPQPTGCYAFVDFTTAEDAEKALRSIPWTKLNGNEVQADIKPTPAMRRKPGTHKGDKGRLKITGLAFETHEDDVRLLFQKYPFTRATLPKYLNSDCPTGYAYVDFNSPADAQLAAVQLSRAKPTILGRWIAVEELTSQQEIRGSITYPVLPDDVAHLSDPKQQFDVLTSVEADENNRAVWKAWWMEEQDINLDI